MDGGVAAGDDVEDEGDEAVLAVAAGEEECALSLLIEQGVAVLHGQFTLTGVVEQGVCDVVVYTQVVVDNAVACRTDTGDKERGVECEREEGKVGDGEVAVGVWELVLDDGVIEGVVAVAGVVEVEGVEDCVGAGGAGECGDEGEGVMPAIDDEGVFRTGVCGVGVDRNGVVEPVADIVAGGGDNGVGGVFRNNVAIVDESHEVGAVVEDVEGVEGESCHRVLRGRRCDREVDLDGGV